MKQLTTCTFDIDCDDTNLYTRLIKLGFSLECTKPGCIRAVLSSPKKDVIYQFLNLIDGEEQESLDSFVVIDDLKLPTGSEIRSYENFCDTDYPEKPYQARTKELLQDAVKELTGSPTDQTCISVKNIEISPMQKSEQSGKGNLPQNSSHRGFTETVKKHNYEIESGIHPNNLNHEAQMKSEDGYKNKRSEPPGPERDEDEQQKAGDTNDDQKESETFCLKIGEYKLMKKLLTKSGIYRYLESADSSTSPVFVTINGAENILEFNALKKLLKQKSIPLNKSEGVKETLRFLDSKIHAEEDFGNIVVTAPEQILTEFESIFQNYYGIRRSSSVSTSNGNTDISKEKHWTVKEENCIDGNEFGQTEESESHTKLGICVYPKHTQEKERRIGKLKNNEEKERRIEKLEDTQEKEIIYKSMDAQEKERRIRKLKDTEENERRIKESEDTQEKERRIGKLKNNEEKERRIGKLEDTQEKERIYKSMDAQENERRIKESEDTQEKERRIAKPKDSLKREKRIDKPKDIEGNERRIRKLTDTQENERRIGKPKDSLKKEKSVDKPKDTEGKEMIIDRLKDTKNKERRIYPDLQSTTDGQNVLGKQSSISSVTPKSKKNDYITEIATEREQRFGLYESEITSSAESKYDSITNIPTKEWPRETNTEIGNAEMSGLTASGHSAVSCYDDDTYNLQTIQQDKYSFTYHGNLSGLIIKMVNTDITKLSVDVIVNTSNQKLMHSGGVAKAIAKAAGKKLEDECDHFLSKYWRVEVSYHFPSSGGNLPAKQVYHAVGPKWIDYGYAKTEECKQDLRLTVLRCLIQAELAGHNSIAFPSISGGTFRVPREICIESYCKAVQHFELLRVMHTMENLQKVYFVDINDDLLNAIKHEFTLNWKIYPDSNNYEFKQDRMMVEYLFTSYMKDITHRLSSSNNQDARPKDSTRVSTYNRSYSYSPTVNTDHLRGRSFVNADYPRGDITHPLSSSHNQDARPKDSTRVSTYNRSYSYSPTVNTDHLRGRSFVNADYPRGDITHPFSSSHNQDARPKDSTRDRRGSQRK